MDRVSVFETGNFGSSPNMPTKFIGVGESPRELLTLKKDSLFHNGPDENLRDIHP